MLLKVLHFDIDKYNKDLDFYLKNGTKISPKEKAVSNYLYSVDTNVDTYDYDDDTIEIDNDYLYKIYTTGLLKDGLVSHVNCIRQLINSGFRKNADVFEINIELYKENERELKFNKLGL